jgi:microcystin-dependent protein
MNPYLAMIFMFGGNFTIFGFAQCVGQTLAISQNTALFSLLGTTFGGNGTTNFQLPDLRSRFPVGAGQGLGLSNYILGQAGGAEIMTLTANNLPAHSHTVAISVTVSASNTAATANVPTVGTSTLGVPVDPYSGDAINLFNGGAPNIALNTLAQANGTTGTAGSSQPFSIVPPYLALNFEIALQGIFPSRT